jgi:DNA-binding Lrp family transcriptional regulator
MNVTQQELVALDRRIVLATQAGLPLHERPYDALAEELGVAATLVKQRLRKMLDDGRIRRIAGVPNHYRLGYIANGMSVWDVHDEHIGALGPQVGELAFVSHCYHRPRHPPDWPYNLFAMVHARSLEEVTQRVAQISALLGDACRAHDVLFSSRILKKTGLRLHRDNTAASKPQVPDKA